MSNGHVIWIQSQYGTICENNSNQLLHEQMCNIVTLSPKSNFFACILQITISTNVTGHVETATGYN